MTTLSFTLQERVHVHSQLLAQRLWFESQHTVNSRNDHERKINDSNPWSSNQHLQNTCFLRRNILLEICQCNDRLRLTRVDQSFAIEIMLHPLRQPLRHENHIWSCHHYVTDLTWWLFTGRVISHPNIYITKRFYALTTSNVYETSQGLWLLTLLDCSLAASCSSAVARGLLSG